MPQDVHDVSIRYVKGVGPSRAKTFAHLGVESVEDLLYLFPRRYEDRRSMTTIAQLKAGEWHTIAGKITRHDSRKTWHTRKHVCEIIIDDGTGCIYGVWFNQPYLSAYFKLGQQVILHGKVETYKERLQIVSPEYEIIEEEESGESLSIGRIVPVYPLTRGMTQRYLRRIIKLSLNRYASKIADILPYDLRKKYNLMNAVKSLANIHFPESFEAQEQAFARISFEEFFLFQVSILMRKLSITQRTGIAHDAARFSI